jgi:hypothetical protein
MILSILAILLSTVAISSNLMILSAIRQHQRHLAICDRRLSANHDSIMDLYNRTNRIESKQ